MKLTLIIAPYDSGHYRSGCGLGPDAILAGGFVDVLVARGHDVHVQDIGKVGDEQGREIATGFAVCRSAAPLVQAARDEGRFPIVFAGNCLTASGAVAGEGADSVVWFDQHGDLNTPETSAYGFLDGMALASLLGMCWRPMTSAIPGFRPIEPARCLLVDARDLDPDEEVLLGRSPIIRASCEEAPEQARKLLAAGATRTHLHLDLDVHDPSVLHVNRYARPGGPHPDELRRVICEIARVLPLSGLTVTAYDPAVDEKAEVPTAVQRLLVDFLAALESV
jgi:arginase